MGKKGFWLALKVTVSVALVVVIVRQIGGLNALSVTISQFSWTWCAAAAFAALAHILLSGLRIWILLAAAGTSVPFGTFLRLYVYSYCFGLILPGQTGDAVIAVFLKQHGVPITVSAAAYVVDKMITFSFMILVALYGIHRLMPSLSLPWIALVLMLGAGAGLLGLRQLPKLRWKQPWLQSIHKRIVDFLEMVHAVAGKKAYICLNVAITVANWGLVGISYYFVFRAIGQHIAWPMVGVIPIMSTFVGYIPISVAGIGTVEYSAIYLFSLIGADQAGVFATYIIQRSLQYILASGLLVVILSARYCLRWFPGKAVEQ